MTTTQAPLGPNVLHKYGCLVRDREAPLTFRFRALFILRNYPKSPIAQEAIKQAIIEENESALFKHEAVYCLGQMECADSVDLFKSLVADKNEDPMVRHEAGEALGVIGVHNESIRDFLKAYIEDENELVRDTCLLAEQRTAWNEDLSQPSKFHSFDPTPPYPSKDLSILKRMFTNPETPLFDRYRAMLAIRDLESEEAIKVLCDEMEKQSSGQALFRHELAFVLGQLHHPSAVDSLITTLANTEQHYVIRHECAFSLGSVGGYALPTRMDLQEKAREALLRYSTDPDIRVSESCVVGLDVFAYEESDEIDVCADMVDILGRYSNMVVSAEFNGEPSENMNSTTHPTE